MNKNEQIQVLSNMKFQLTNLYSQFNNLSYQINNAGSFSDVIMEMIDISFQIINYGTQLLNLGINYTNTTLKDYNLKDQADTAINQLNKIKFNFEEKINPVYNIVFNERGLKTTICWRGNITIQEMLSKYLIKKSLNLNEMNKYRFFYNSNNLNNNEYINKNVESVFTYPNAQIQVEAFG